MVSNENEGKTQMSESVAVVTGATQGIGRASALRLAKDFSALALAGRNGKALKEVAAEVKSIGAEPLEFNLDLSLKESAEILIKGTLDRFGRIDALLNIAGAVPQIDLFEMTDEQWRAGLELKLHGARRLTILAWEALKASKGSVVLISGSAALDPKPGFAAVATINAAIIAIAKAFAEQGIKDGVQVNGVPARHRRLPPRQSPVATPATGRSRSCSVASVFPTFTILAMSGTRCCPRFILACRATRQAQDGAGHLRRLLRQHRSR